MIDFGIYRDGRLFATVPVRNVQFSKTRKGAADASCLLPVPLERAARWVGSGGLSEVRITAPWGEDIWTGRIEDIGASTGGTTVRAFGYARALADVPYTGLWSVTGVDDWRDVRADEVATALPARWRMDRNGRLFIAPQKGEAFANNSNAGGQTYAIPHNSARTITNVVFSYSFTAPTNWKGVLNSYTDAWGSGATDWELVGNGANQSGAASVTLTNPRARIGFFMFNSTGGSVTKSTDTGVDFLEITSIRIKTTTAATVRASAIAAALRARSHTVNSNQLVNSDALIEQTSTDLLSAIYEDVYPSSILDNLAGITHDWGVDPRRQFYFKSRTVRRTWTIEAGRINLPHSLDSVANSAYVVFRAPDGRKLRTEASSSQTGIDAFGLTRRVVLDNDTTSEAAALAARDGFLATKEGESIVADIETLHILSSSGRRAKAWEIEPGDRVRVQNAPQYVQFGEAFGFVVNRMEYNHETGSLKLEPDMPTPTVANMLAGAVSGRGVAASGGGTSASAADFVLDTVFYVEDYGSNIQAALNAANAAGGGTVLLQSRRTYTVSISSGIALIVYPNITIDGNGATIKLANSVGNYQTVFSGVTSGADLSNLTIKNLTIDQNSTNNTVTSTGQLSGNPRYAIRIFAGQHIRIQDCVFKDIQAVNTITANGAATVSDVHVTGCKFYGVGGASVDFDHSTIYFQGKIGVFSGNTFQAASALSSGGRTAIEMHGSQWVVSDNTITDYMIGIIPTGVAPETVGTVVSNNTVRNCRYGILIYSQGYTPQDSPFGIDGMTITDNQIHIVARPLMPAGMAFGGIAFDPNGDMPVRNLRIANNSVSVPLQTAAPTDSNASVGIGMFSLNSIAVSNVAIENNTVINFPMAGIRLSVGDLSESRICNNILTNPGSTLDTARPDAFRSGIVVAVTNVSGMEIDNNQIIDNLGTSRIRHGIYVLVSTSSKELYIRDNTIRATGSTTTSLLYQILPSTNVPLPFLRGIMTGWIIPPTNCAAGSEVRDGGRVYTNSTGGTTWPSKSWGSAAPGSGAYARGSVVYDTAPAASGKRGWICVAAGSPGTWKAWGAIDA